MLKFKFPLKCPNCNSKTVGGSDSCNIYECGGKISVTNYYGDCLTFIFKNCQAEEKEKVKARFISNNKHEQTKGE